jgi:hypothetical protein
MPITWTKGSPQEFVSMGERIKDQLYKALAVAMAVIAQQAAITAQAFTAERGTAHSRGAGRIDSGDMAKAIEADVVLKADEIIGKFGFLGEKADYFKYQTITGFNHWLSGEFIEPTFALRDAKVIAEGEVIEAIEAAIRSVKL